MADVFGYDKTVKGPGEIVSASAVMVKLGDSGKVNLAQAVTIDYQRTVTPNYELGSETVFLTAGHSAGTCRIERLVGETKALEPYVTSNSCDPTTITVAKSGDLKCSKDIGTLTMKGLPSSVSVAVQAGQFTVTDSATYQIGNLEIN